MNNVATQKFNSSAVCHTSFRLNYQI